MRLLLDTNALLWALTNSPRIEEVKDLLLADENEVFVSAVSLVGDRHQNTHGQAGCRFAATTRHCSRKWFYGVAAIGKAYGNIGDFAQVPQ